MAGRPDARLATSTVCWSVLKLLRLSRPLAYKQKGHTGGCSVVEDVLTV